MLFRRRRVVTFLLGGLVVVHRQASADASASAADCTTFIECRNGYQVVGGRQTYTTCREACQVASTSGESNCCPSFDSCDGFTGRVCADPHQRSCFGPRACQYATISTVVNSCDAAGGHACWKAHVSNAVVKSCHGQQSCAFAGRGGSLEAIQESCHGPRACFAVADGGTMGSVTRSCNAPSACEFVAEDGEVGGLTDMCNDEYACDKSTEFSSTGNPTDTPTDPPSTVAPTQAPIAAIHTEAPLPVPTQSPVVAIKPKPAFAVPKAASKKSKKAPPPTASPTAMPTRTSLRAGPGGETHTTDDPQTKKFHADSILSFMETVVLPYLPIVVGVCAGIALILLMGMLYQRRKSKKRISKDDDDDTQSGNQSVDTSFGLVKLAQDEKTEVTEETEEMSARAEEENIGIGAPPQEPAGKSGRLAGRFLRAVDGLRGISFWRRKGEEKRESNVGLSVQKEKENEQTDQSVASVDYDYSKYYVKVQKEETEQPSGGDAVETGTAVVVSDDGSVVHEFIEAYPLPKELDGDGDQSIASVDYDYSKYYVSVKDRK